ncbi:MAG: EAL domain-containing protein, partial [Oscillospiraceae bacterium]|nr:EAL domain-containing protein [Oscillospiraceae bacterium]
MKQRPIMLIADDMMMNRAILTSIFKEDYELVVAEDGVQALEMLQKHPVDIVLLDIIMPRLDGFEVLSFMRRQPGFAQIPVIINTQMGEDDKQIKALDLGADDFIVKPYNSQIVKQRVGNVMRRSVLEQRELRRSLTEKTEHLDALINSVPGGIGMYESINDKMLPLYYNDKVCALSNYNREEYAVWIKGDALNAIYPEDREDFLRQVRDCILDDSNLDYDCRISKKGGGFVWVRICGVKHKTSQNGNLVFYAIFMDVTKEHETREKMQSAMYMLEYNAEHEPLTGLYNRSTFYAKTAKMLQSNRDISYVLITWDIARFKVINDLFGSAVGDRILQTIAMKLDSMLCDVGTYSRLAADNFAVCIPQEYMTVEEMRAQLDEFLGYLNINYDIPLYAGVYEIEDVNLPVDQMCDRANMAKDTVLGSYVRRYAVYDDALRKTLLEEQEMVGEMDTALASGQFCVYLQPIYSLTSGTPIGAEALVRWIHPQKGMISPAAFIPLFERNSFITELDYFVWEEVCSFIHKRMEQNLPIVPVSVNVSRVNLYNPYLCDMIVALTEKYNIPTAMLKLEITETAYTEDPHQLLEVIDQLQEKGFIILMDDFGSGYSSLNMLKDIPANVLKLDMRFIDDIEENSRGGNVLSSVVRMAKWLNMDVIAEDVETKEQLAFLRSIGCDSVQGFYFARPMEKDKFELLLGDKGQKTQEEIKKNIESVDFDLMWTTKGNSAYMMEELLDGMALYELHEEELQLIRVNDNYYTVFGDSPKTLFTKNNKIEEKILPEDKLPLLQACHMAVQSGETQEQLVRRYHADGNLMWTNLHIRYLGKRGTAHVLCFGIDDVTKLPKRERERNEAQWVQILKFAFTEIAELNFTKDTYKVIYRDSNHSDQYPRQASLGETLKKHVVNIIRPDYLEAVAHWDDADWLHKRLKACATGSLRVELQMYLADEQYHTVNAIITEIPRDGCDVFLVAIRVMDEAIQMEQLTNENLLLKAQSQEYDRYRIAVQQAGIITLEYYLQDKTFFASEGYSQFVMSEYPVEELPKSDVICKIVHPEDLQLLQNFFEKEKTDTAEAVELRLKRTDDTFVWCRLAYNCLYNEENLQIGVIGSITNIHQEKEMNIVLRSTKEELQSLFSYLPAGVGIYKISDKVSVKYLNDYAYSLLGLKGLTARQADDIAVISFLDFIDEDVQALRLETQKIGTYHKENTISFLRLDGTRIYLHTVTTFLWNEELKAVLCYCAMVDISRQKEVEGQLQQKNELCQLLLDNSGLIVFDYNVQNDVLQVSLRTEEGVRREKTFA